MLSILGWLVKIFNKLTALYDICVNIQQEQRQFRQDVDAQFNSLFKTLGIGVPVNLNLTFTIKGEQIMPVQITDKQAVVVTPSETDADGNPVQVNPANISYSVSDPTALTLQVNNTASPVAAPDSQSIPPGGAWVQAVQAAGHLGAFQLSSTDSGNSLNAQDTVTVVAGAATALSMNFGTPQ